MQRFRLAIAFVFALAFGLPVASAGTSITFNGAAYTVPSVADANWGQNVSNYLTAIASGTLQKTGGSFTLTNDANFGSTYGLVAQYVKSQTAPVAGTGVLRLGNGDGVTWRNAGNSADLALSVNGSNVLTFNGTPLVGAATGSPYQVLTIPSGGGAGAYGAVALGQSAAVTGMLGVANGGTGLTSGTSGGVLAFTASGTVTSSNALPANGVLYGGGAGFTPGATAAGLNGQVLLATTGAAPGWGSVNLGSSTVTGTLAVANGGTGATTTTGALNALLPTQTSNSGKVLSTDGSNASWAAALTTTLSSGNIFVGNGSNVATAVALSGDATLTSAGLLTIGLSQTISSPSANQSASNTGSSHFVYTPSANVSLTLDNSFIAGRTIVVTNVSSSNSITIKANDGTTVRTVYPATTGAVITKKSAPASNTDWDGVGPVESNWTSVTGSGSAGSTATFSAFQARRVGSDLLVKGVISWSGAPATLTSIAVNIPQLGPTALSLDTGVTATTLNHIYGDAFYRDGTGSSSIWAKVITNDSSSVLVQCANSASPFKLQNIAKTDPIVIDANTKLTVTFAVPISGWSANKG